MDNQNFNPNEQNYQQPPQPQQAPQYYAPAPGPVRMVTEKSIAMCIILSIVTCGIYGLYWLYTLTEDLNALSGDPNATSGGMVILLSIVTCNIYLWYWLYKQGDTVDKVKTSRGLPSGNSGILYVILAFVGLGIIAYALMQNEINTIIRG